MAKGSKKQKPPNEKGYIQPRDIVDEMRDSYIDYAMSVIVSRALPDVRDGLKPVHRRILYTMHEMGLTPGGKYRKSATVVGNTMSRYHPHGDSSIYDALVRMAQSFSLRYPLIDGQGNFGSIDGDSAAAYRYTEARLSKIGQAMLRDISKGTVDFIENYDTTKKEPVVLPSPLPQLLLNGCLGIAVGMATSIPSHNLSEVIEATVYLVNNPKTTTEGLFKFIKGPDFPTGGIIYDKKSIVAAYSQGRGPIVIRGKAEVVEKGKLFQILISEIPFGIKKSTLVQQFANLVSERKLKGIKDIRDESDKEGLRIAIDLQKNAHPQQILNRLYKWTSLQTTFRLNMVALAEGIQPRVLSLAEVLNYFILHRKEVITRRTRFDLEKAKERAHILKGLHKALGKIDLVIKIIKSSKDRGVAQKNLMQKMKLSEIQANAILETKLSALARLERQKIEKELKEMLARIKELTAILKSPKKIKEVVKKELNSLKQEFGDQRKTKIYVQKVGEIIEEDLIPQEPTVITLTQGGYIKRINPAIYRLQRRGGKGILGMKIGKNDIVEHLVFANTKDPLLFFTDSGKVFRILSYEIPEGKRVARGRSICNFLEISSQERVLSIIPFPKENKPLGARYLIMVTKKGIIKRTSLEDFENIRRSGLIAIKLKKGDLLQSVATSTGQDSVLLTTRRGQSIHFKEQDIRVMGRTAAGVKGIGLKKGDEVIGMDVIKSRVKPQVSKVVLVVSENGFSKRTDLKEYRIQKRGGIGIKTAKITKRTGELIASKLLGEQEDLLLISQKGQVLRTKLVSVSKISRVTQGVRVMRLKQGDSIASVVCI